MTPFRTELLTIARLSLPVIVTQLGTMTLGVVDNLMLGRLSVDALNASSLGRVWVMGTYLIAVGLVFGIDPFVSQAHGAGDGRAAGRALQRGLIIALGVSVPLAVLWCFTEPVLILFRQDPHLAEQAQRYALAQLPGLPFLLCFNALRQYLQGRGIVAPAMWVVLAANLVNALGNWILIFGKLGAPALGVVGAGVATGVTECAMFAMLLLLIVRGRLHESAWAPWSRESFAPAGLWAVIRVGAPVAVTIGLEMWAFQIATLWSGRLGETALAAHTIVLNLASVSFMVPLGISIGAAARIGNLIGAGRGEDAQKAAQVAFVMGASVMALSALAFLLARHWLPAAYTSDESVLALSAAVLPIAAAFQLFDGLQVVGCGILRGMGRALPGALINLFGYYALALPFAYVFGLRGEHGLRGVWWGLSLGLAAVALSLIAWVSWRGPRTVRRVEGS